MKPDINKLFKLTGIDRFCKNCTKAGFKKQNKCDKYAKINPEMIRGDFKCEDIAKCILDLRTSTSRPTKHLLQEDP